MMMMDTPCLCGTARGLVKDYDEGRAQSLIPALNCHLRDLRTLLARSKSLTREVQYRITPNTQRTMKALYVDSVNLGPVDQVCERFTDDAEGFWRTAPSDDVVHVELRRRLACVVIFLRSKLDAEVWVPPEVATVFQGQQQQQNFTDIRHSGRKYIKIARKLGGLGSLFWLPLEIPPSTYERYLNMDDEEVFGHLNSLDPQAERYAHLVRRLILSRLGDPSPSCSYYNLFVDYADVVPASDQLLLVLHALGGSDVPEILLKSVRFPQRRWNADGEISSINATDFGLPVELVNLLSDDERLSQTTASPYITKGTLEDGTVSWSLGAEVPPFFSQALRPQTMDELGVTALKVICFACPPCYEGNTNWSAPLKKAIWPLLERAAKTYKVPAARLGTQVLEAFLYFCERDSVPIRRAAVELARSSLRRSMPYHLHASVVLFRSILDRLDGDLGKSKARIGDFLTRNPQRPTTRRDHALRGRLHISQLENKIKSYDDDVPLSIYRWEAAQPLSHLDIEITSRLQGVAARFFQSVGDFAAARASLEQFLTLYTTNPIRVNTRRLIVGRLADIYCEMQEYPKVVEILQPELDAVDNAADRRRRPFRRLLLASVEANIGLGRLDEAEALLKELQPDDSVMQQPPELHDIHDQQLHMRRLLASARIAHTRRDYHSAVARWKFAREEVERMYTLQSGGGFTAATIHLSLAHAELLSEDVHAARHSWSAGMEILRSEKCEFWIPIVPTVWLQSIVTEVYELQGWPFRMMLPGGKPDVTWPRPPPEVVS